MFEVVVEGARVDVKEPDDFFVAQDVDEIGVVLQRIAAKDVERLLDHFRMDLGVRARDTADGDFGLWFHAG